MIEALNGNTCNAYFVSGKINELKKKKSCILSLKLLEIMIMMRVKCSILRVARLTLTKYARFV